MGVGKQLFQKFICVTVLSLRMGFFFFLFVTSTINHLWFHASNEDKQLLSWIKIFKSSLMSCLLFYWLNTVFSMLCCGFSFNFLIYIKKKTPYKLILFVY